MNKKKDKLLWTILILAGFYLVSMIVGRLMPNEEIGNVAVIPIYGEIAISGDGSYLSGDYATPDKIIPKIEKAENDPKIKAIVFEINSPGGTPVATDEISMKIKSVSKPTVSWIREIGTSGAYWIAASTDHIVANRMSVTGSIGVIGSYLEFSGLLDKYNISYQRFVSGKYKDLGSPFRNISVEERELYQDDLDMLHEFFIEEVAENRNLPIEDVKMAANGMFYLGAEALDMGLVDELGGIDEVTLYLEEELNSTVTLSHYKDKVSIYDMIMMSSDPHISIGNLVKGRSVSYELR